MPRTYKSKDKQTKPERAGEQNLSEEYISTRQEKDPEKAELLGTISDLYQKAMSVTKERKKKGTNWTADELEEATIKYFDYCAERAMKPSMVSLGLFLGVGKSQLYDWKTHPDKYSELSPIVARAAEAIEQQYMERAEQYPTANIFFLKAGHGYKDTQSIEISNSETSKEDIDETIKMLGLGD